MRCHRLCARGDAVLLTQGRLDKAAEERVRLEGRLIQFLVTSNPTPAYVTRVAEAVASARGTDMEALAALVAANFEHLFRP